MCWNMTILDWEGSYLKEPYGVAYWSLCHLLSSFFFLWTHTEPESSLQACRCSWLCWPYCSHVSADNHSEKIQCKATHSFCFLPQIQAPLVVWNAGLRKRFLFFLTVTVNPLPGCWILKKIIATFCDDLMLLWIFPLSQKSTYLWEVVRGWSRELGNFSPLSIHPSNTYRGSII